MADVARTAGVSAMTVSRVLNGEPNVNPLTREKVDAAIAQLQYVPNPAARSLAAGRQCRIALVHSNPSAAYLSELLMGCLSRTGSLNVELVVEHSEPDGSVVELVRRIREHRANAVLLPPPLCDNQDLLEALQGSRLRLAQIATGRPAAFAHAVTIDDEAAAHAMTSYLLDQGHRRIGFIAGDGNQSATGQRKRGFERALRERGIELDPACLAQGDFTYRSGLVAGEALLARSDRPSAIFASNDDMAAAVVAVAHKMRLDVPRDLSVCGFDDTAMATTIWPELTTVRQPIAEMAGIATSLLAEAVGLASQGRPANVRHVNLAFEVVIRGSTREFVART